MIYFIQAGIQGPIKIGMVSDTAWDGATKALKHRRETLQSGCPYPLRVRGVQTGGREDEIDLHQQFLHLRIRGEWFKPDNELIAYITENTTRDPGEVGRAQRRQHSGLMTETTFMMPLDLWAKINLTRLRLPAEYGVPRRNEFVIWALEYALESLTDLTERPA